MLNSMYKPMQLLIMSLLISSCALFVDPHETFKSHMQDAVGKKVGRPTNWAREENLVKKATLPNGNIENEYRFRRTCRYFFEYEPHSLTIVGWRYEGKKSDCYINP
jgi:hypothetical protein